MPREPRVERVRVPGSGGARHEAWQRQARGRAGASQTLRGSRRRAATGFALRPTEPAGARDRTGTSARPRRPRARHRSGQGTQRAGTGPRAGDRSATGRSGVVACTSRRRRRRSPALDDQCVRTQSAEDGTVDLAAEQGACCRHFTSAVAYPKAGRGTTKDRQHVEFPELGNIEQDPLALSGRRRISCEPTTIGNLPGQLRDRREARGDRRVPHPLKLGPRGDLRTEPGDGDEVRQQLPRARWKPPVVVGADPPSQYRVGGNDCAGGGVVERPFPSNGSHCVPPDAMRRIELWTSSRPRRTEPVNRTSRRKAGSPWRAASTNPRAQTAASSWTRNDSSSRSTPGDATSATFVA